MTTPDMIQHNLEQIRSNMLISSQKSGRNISDVTLMAVTKTKPAEIVRCLIGAGLRVFGENYPDETAEKRDAFQGENITLAMIGHLQSRKAKLVCEIFDEFHSLDRLEIAVKMNRLCQEKGIIMPVFLECNVGDEKSKSGWHFPDDSVPDTFLADFEQISMMAGLDVRGLMILPPYTEEPENNRKYFVRTRNLAAYLNQYQSAHLTDLSMGTSIDYGVAIEEGATMIRIGTALAGPRDYSN